MVKKIAFLVHSFLAGLLGAQAYAIKAGDMGISILSVFSAIGIFITTAILLKDEK